MGRTGMRSLRALGSTIQVLDKPRGCHDGDKQLGPMGMIREQAILRTRSNLGQRSGKESMFPKEGEGGDIKMENGAWQVRMDYSSLNRICAKDMYPFPKVEEELASLMRYLYKCFLRLPIENSQIRMAEGNEEKTRFHTE
ncbi:hypothetical protein Tco_0746936 [Tanacetum coccineum]